MKKRILLLLLAAMLVFTLSGCRTGFSMNTSELMRPPKATGGNAQIQELIDKHAGDNYTLKYPQNGTYRTAITTVDLDGDLKDEAIAFYLPAGETQTIHLLIMKEINSQWVVLGDHLSTSTMVDRLLFADLDGDSVKEIIVGYGSYNSLINTMSLYLLDENRSVELASSYTYTDIKIADFTDGGKDEIMLLSLYTTEKSASAALVTLNRTRNNLYTIAESPMDDSVVSYAQLLSGDIFEGQFGLVVDGLVPDSKNANNSYYKTQILFYDDSTQALKSVTFTKDEPTNQAYRNYAFLSEDIDSDGVIEIPNTFRLPLAEGMVDVSPAPVIYWCEYSFGGDMTVKEKTIASISYNFYFFVPEKWNDSFTAYANYSTNEVTICQWDEKKGVGQELLTLKMFEPSVWNDGASSKGYTQLAVSDSYVYGFKIPQSNSPLMLTNEEIAEAFVLRDKQ